MFVLDPDPFLTGMDPKHCINNIVDPSVVSVFIEVERGL